MRFTLLGHIIVHDISRGSTKDMEKTVPFNITSERFNKEKKVEIEVKNELGFQLFIKKSESCH